MKVPQPGRGGQTDPSRCLREAEDGGLVRPPSWSLTPGKQVGDVESLELLRA